MAEVTIQQALEIAFRHLQSGRLAEAENVFRQMQSAVGANPPALYGLGVHAAQAGLDDTALRLFQATLMHDPEMLDAHNGIVMVIDRHRQAVALQPNSAPAWNRLGFALASERRFPEAIEAFQRAAALDPRDGSTRFNLGRAYQENKDLNHAVDAYARALELQLASADPHSRVGSILLETELREPIVDCLREAIAAHPDNVLAHCTLALALLHVGMVDEAIAHERKAIELAPDVPVHHDNLLNAMRLSDSISVDELLREHQRWAARFAEPLEGQIPVHQNDRSADRILRVGYVSPDLRGHAVGLFLLQILSRHDRSGFHITCYSNSRSEDQVTAQIRGAVQEWRVTTDWSDERVATQIVDDRIDILVDLAQHSPGNRMLVFARKPAPVQLTYLGYPGTTGLKTFDAQLSDPYIDPPGRTEQYSTEPIVRLPDTYWCYRPIADVSTQIAPPAMAAQSVTFGCLNKLEKSSPSAMRLWARILNRVPKSRLILNAPLGAHRQRIFDLFKNEGISSDRIVLVPRLPTREYFGLLQQIDIALDPFPYNGGTTTCDALWMGVPVVTLAGVAGVQRSGASLLTTAGMPQLIATTPNQYVQIAVDLANDLPGLIALRSAIRNRLAGSPLMDVSRFVWNLEAIYRDLWRQWLVK